MALRIPWDKYETSLLIDTWINVNDGRISRQEAITGLSASLRQRAIANGLEIDDVYRNENGISMQLHNIHRLMQRQPKAEEHNTKIFIEMVELYFSDREQFEKILQEAKGGAQAMKSNEELFVEWLSSHVASSRLSDDYMAMTEIESFAQKRRLISGSIYNVSDYKVTAKIIDAINSDRIFRVMHKKQMRFITEAAQLFHRYTKETQHREIPSVEGTSPVDKQGPARQSTDEQTQLGTEQQADKAFDDLGHLDSFSRDPLPQAELSVCKAEPIAPTPTADEPDLVVNFERDVDFSFTRPLSVSYFGDEYLVSSWRRLYAKVCSLLFEDYPDIFRELRNSSLSGNRQNLVYSEEVSTHLTTPMCIADGFYVEGNRSASDIVQSIKSLLDICRVDYENLEIHYQKISEQETDEGKEFHSDSIKGRPADPIIAYLEQIDLSYVDLRDRLGCLWIIGGRDITNKIIPLQDAGVSLHFKAGGGTATKGADAWWTKDHPTSLELAPDPVVDLDRANQKTTRDGRTAFGAWLSSQTSSSGTIRTTLWAVSKVSDYAVQYQLISDTLFSVEDVSALEQIWEQLNDIDEFLDFRRKNSVAIFAYNKYVQFRGGDGVFTRKVSQPRQEQVAPRSEVSGSEAEFRKWLSEQGYAANTVYGYAFSVRTTDEYARQHGLSQKPLFHMVSGEEVCSVWKKLQSDHGFMEYNREQHNRFSAAMRLYVAFRTGKGGEMPVHKPRLDPRPTGKTKSAPKPGVHPVQAEFETWLLDHNTPSGFAKTYCVAVQRIGEYLLKNEQEDRHVFSIFDVSRLERILDALRNDENYAARSGSQNPSLDFYAFRKYIKFRANRTADDVDGVTTERYTALLRENFENGFRVHSMIDQNRLKQYYADTYGEEVPQSDDELLAAIQRIGDLQDGRVFVRDGNGRNDLLADIQADIAKAFHQGASCVYLSCVFEKYQDPLAAQLQIYSEDVLGEQLLTAYYGLYRMTKQFFYVSGRNPDVMSDVLAVMKRSQAPLNYGQLQEILWYLPIEQIKHCLVVKQEIVNVAQETYFYAYNLPVSSDELEQIAKMIDGRLAQKSFITDGELREMIDAYCPSVAINTQSFTTWGLRNALSVLLGGRFSFHGAIISEMGQEVNMAQAFEAFCESHDEMSLDELKEFAKEMNTVIYWDSVFEKMLRVSQDKFVRKDAVQFNVPDTDAVLDQLIEGNYEPLKGFSLFLHFPTISVQWNEFVLEGYVAQHSRDFVLLHVNYTAEECCGAIVRRSSRIKDFRTLIVDVLAHDGTWKTRRDALSLLVEQGYLQRKRYSEIESVMAEARQLRMQMKP